MHALKPVSPGGPNLWLQVPVSVAVNAAKKKKKKVAILLSEHALALQEKKINIYLRFY